MPRELRDALGTGDLFCVYLPEVDITTGQVPALESLVRWTHPRRGLLAPARFVPVAEAAGLADLLFAHALDIRTVAEGVESAEQLLAAMECDFARDTCSLRPSVQ